MRIEKPIDFDAVDRQPVDLIFALFAPEGSGVDHLKALALVSRTMRDSGVCAKLRANDSPDTLYTILTEAQSTRAVARLVERADDLREPLSPREPGASSSDAVGG